MIAGRIAQAVDPDAARRDAQHILSDRKFRSDPAPRPFRSQLRWIGDRFHGIFAWFGRVFSHVPGWLWLGLAVLVVLAVLARIIVVTNRRRTGARSRGGAFLIGDHDDIEDPDALERAADEAERDGNLDRAVRLRFRAGLLRLGDRGAIAYRPSVTTGEIRRVLGSRTFDELARTFEAVTYGGQAAQRPDVDAARREWPRVLEETKPR